MKDRINKSHLLTAIVVVSEFLADHRIGMAKNYIFRAAFEALEDEMFVSKRSLLNHLQRLNDLGFIQTYERYQNHYKITLPDYLAQYILQQDALAETQAETSILDGVSDKDYNVAQQTISFFNDNFKN